MKALILGRTNVGKSSLFNRLVGQKKALVIDGPGITRDLLKETIEWWGCSFEIIDSGGWPIEKKWDELASEIVKKIKSAIKESDLFILVVDGRAGLQEQDKQLRQSLRKTGKPLLLFVNKADQPEKTDLLTAPFFELSAEIVSGSCEKNYGIDEIAEWIIHQKNQLAKENRSNQLTEEKPKPANSNQGADPKEGLKESQHKKKPVNQQAQKALIKKLNPTEMALKSESKEPAKGKSESKKPVNQQAQKALIKKLNPTEMALKSKSKEPAKGKSESKKPINQQAQKALIKRLNPTEMALKSKSKEPVKGKSESKKPVNQQAQKTLIKRLNSTEMALKSKLKKPVEEKNEAKKQPTQLFVIGRANSGKSLLCNQILKAQRMIVSSRPGATLDTVTERFSYNKRDYSVSDNPGARAGARSDTEKISFAKSRSALEKADIALLVTDALIGPGRQDARLVELCLKKHKPVILLVNKIDLLKDLPPERAKQLKEKIKTTFHFYPDLPVAFVSAKTGKNKKLIFNKIEDIMRKAKLRIPTPELNRFFTQVIRKAPAPVYGASDVKFYYITQTKKQPPEFIAFANYPKGVTPAYRRFIINSIKKQWGLRAVPIMFRALPKK